ncbi:MAG: exonuclease SbcCD subunit D [Spirochaetota bacterium]
MKFFHIADLHLGKSVYEHSLLPDQQQVLSAVTAAVRAESPAAVIIAGDVFDRAVPPPEAVRLFGNFLADLKAMDPTLVVAVIPGNHDSATRLSFASGILGLSGVHIRADAKDVVNPVVIRRDGEQARLWLLPFLSPGALRPEMLPKATEFPGSQSSKNLSSMAQPLEAQPLGAQPQEQESKGIQPSSTQVLEIQALETPSLESLAVIGKAAQESDATSSMDPSLVAEPSLLRSQADLFAAAISMIQAAMATTIADTKSPAGLDKSASHKGIASLNEPASHNGIASLNEPARKKGTTERSAPIGELNFNQASVIHTSAGHPSDDQASEGYVSSSLAAAEILVCHAFATGGAAGESERVFLGSAELVDPALFKAFDYVALGHLHRCQSAGAKGMYAGSPIAYAFSEGQVDRGFLVVEVRPGSYSSEFRLIKPLRRMVRISGSYDQVLRDLRWQEYEGDYIEAILDDADAVLNPMGPLRERFPYLLSLRQAAFDKVPGSGQDLDSIPGDDQDEPLAEDDFVAFHQKMRDCPPDESLMELFTELYREATDEAP